MVLDTAHETGASEITIQKIPRQRQEDGIMRIFLHISIRDPLLSAGRTTVKGKTYWEVIQRTFMFTLPSKSRFETSTQVNKEQNQSRHQSGLGRFLHIQQSVKRENIAKSTGNIQERYTYSLFKEEQSLQQFRKTYPDKERQKTNSVNVSKNHNKNNYKEIMAHQNPQEWN